MTRRVRRAPASESGPDSEALHTLGKLRRQGLQTPARPEGDIPELPRAQLTDLDDASLMGLFAELTAWSGYLSVQVACAQIDERAVDRDLEVAEATALLSNWGGGSGDRVTVAKARRVTDPDVQAERQRQAELHAYRKLVEVLATNVDRDAALISRELTRRTSQLPITRRNDRWTP